MEIYMTSEELFQDLKQYIDARVVTKSDLAELERRVNAHTDKQVELLDQKLDTITEAIGEAHQASEAKLDDHEHRIAQLERRAA